MWNDVTTYSRDDKDKQPRVWHFDCGDLRVVVHRHIHYAPDAWLLTCSPFFDKRELYAKDADHAKAEALALVREKVKTLAEALAV